MLQRTTLFHSSDLSSAAALRARRHYRFVTGSEVADVEFREVKDRPKTLTSVQRNVSPPAREGSLVTDSYDHQGRPYRHLPPPGSMVDVRV